MRRAPGLALLCAGALVACGRYGPPVRSTGAEPAPPPAAARPSDPAPAPGAAPAPTAPEPPAERQP